MDISRLTPFLKQAAESLNPQVSQLSSNLLGQGAAPLGENLTQGESLSARDEENDSSVHNHEGKLLNNVFPELDMQNKVEEAKENAKFASYWDMLKEAIDKKRSYSCLMVKMPVDISEAISEFQKQIDPKDIYSKEVFGLEKESHVTVLYGFHSQSLFPVKKVIDKQYGKDTISGSLGKVSLFENTEYDVLKFEVESEDLQELNKICKTLPYTSDYPDYHPHCTISYIKKGTCKDLVGKTIKNNTFSTSELFFSNKDSVKTNFSLATIEKKSNLTLWQKLSNGLSKKTK